ARALATNPEVVLMDEPASALDPSSTSRIEDLIFELKKSYTIVIVTHNMQQAARISDNTAFFYKGRMVEMDATSQLFTRPRQKQTEDYITGRFGETGSQEEHVDPPDPGSGNIAPAHHGDVRGRRRSRPPGRGGAGAPRRQCLAGNCRPRRRGRP